MIRRALLSLALGVGLALPIAAGPARATPETYALDPDHLAVAFLVSHIGFANTLGMFRDASGSFVFDDEAGTLSDLRVTVQTASVDTGHAERDGHLRSGDFLDSSTHPTMTFTLREALPTGERTGQVIGDLTLRGVTRPITLDVTLNKIGRYPFGAAPPEVVGVSVRGSLNRSDWGMTYGVADGLVGDTVEIIIEAEAQQQ